MSDRLTLLEERVAALEREVSELRVNGRPAAPSAVRKPLEEHPLYSKKPPRELWAELEANRLRELGLEDVKPIGAVRLQQLLLEDGLDPNGTEFSRGIIEMREE